MGCYGPDTEKMAQNECAVEDVLRGIFNAQEKFKEDRLKDLDGDGQGEYGFLLDLAVQGDADHIYEKKDKVENPMLFGWIVSPRGRGNRHVLVCREHDVEIYMQDRRGFNVWDAERSDPVTIDFQERSYLASAVPHDAGVLGRYWYVMDRGGVMVKFPFREFDKDGNTASSGIVPTRRDETGALFIDLRKAVQQGWKTVP